MTSLIANARKSLPYAAPPVRVRAGAAVPRGPVSLALLPHQTPPAGAWRRWLLLAGRGAGKTQAGAAWLLEGATPGARLGVIAPTFADVRDVCFEGPSGLLAVARALGLGVEGYNRGMAEARINGALLKGYSADQPDRLRGPQHHRLWFDELAAMRYGQDTYDMAMLGLRLGDDPRAVLTTTPRPTALVRGLLADAETAVTKATTYDNPHLPEAFREGITARYSQTRLGRQELFAEILDDVPGALWTLALLDATRVQAAPALQRVVVAVDVKAGGDQEGGETGIVVAGRVGEDGYTLADYSTDGGPATWARAVIRAYQQHRADAVVVERNQGGAMITHVLRLTPGGADLPIREVWATRGKYTRAEPIANLWEQGRAHHVGLFPALEDQQRTYVPGETSPDRLDALVWAYAELFPSLDASAWSPDALAALSRPRPI